MRITEGTTVATAAVCGRLGDAGKTTGPRFVFTTLLFCRQVVSSYKSKLVGLPDQSMAS